jgi:hypothetical protein
MTTMVLVHPIPAPGLYTEHQPAITETSMTGIFINTSNAFSNMNTFYHNLAVDSILQFQLWQPYRSAPHYPIAPTSTKRRKCIAGVIDTGEIYITGTTTPTMLSTFLVYY